MAARLSTFLLKLLHALLWLLAVVALVAVLALCALAYGVPGSWFQARIDALVPAEVGQLTLRHVAFRPGAGLVLNGVTLRNAGGTRVLASLERGAFAFRLWGGGGVVERLRAVTLEGLFVAQVDRTPAPPEAEPAPAEQRRPFPDLSGIALPHLRNVRLHLTDPDVLEVRVREILATLDTTPEGGGLRFRDIRGAITERDENAEADVTLDLRRGTVTAAIRGFITQTRLNGIYRALDFPIIERYSNKFKLRAPAWADCLFTVGLDKYRNIFDLRVNIVSRDGGTYCGVPFDEAQGTIRCRGVWDTVTEIGPIIIRRGGKVAATGTLRFDCPRDRFEFTAEGNGLHPDETLRLIDMPFTGAIPPMQCAEPPTLSVRGAIPLMSEQTPASVVLQGTLRAPEGGLFERVPLASASADFAMTNGVFSLRGLRLGLPHGGTLKGTIDIAVPPSAEYTDIDADFQAADASLADLLTPFGLNTLTNCVANGSATLRCRTDATFAKSLQSSFDLTVDGGLIGRLPLFAGLTDLIADAVPGISSVTDASTVRLRGIAQDGVFSVPDLTLSGDLFSVEGPVSYDLPKDAVEALVIAGVFKRDSLMGTLTRWTSVPFTRLVWQIHVTGPLAKPEWHVHTFVEKLWDKATGKPTHDHDEPKDAPPPDPTLKERRVPPAKPEKKPHGDRSFLGNLWDKVTK